MTLETIVEEIPARTQVKTSWWKRTLATGALLATMAISAACGVADLGKSNECDFDSDCEKPNVSLQCDDGLCNYTANSGDLSGRLYCEFDNECFNGDNCDNNVCGDSGNIPPPTQNYIVLSPNTKILTDSDSNDLLAVSSGTLTFTGGSDYALGLRTEDIVVTGIHQQTPQGLLRAVSTIQNNGSKIEIETTYASLEDAVKEANLTIPIQFSNDNETIYAPLTGTETAQFPLTVYTLNVDFDNTNIYQNIITLDGSLHANLDSNLSIKIKGNKIQDLRYTISGEEVLELKIKGEISQELHKELPPYEPVQLSPFVFGVPIGPIIFPVVVTPNASITFGVDTYGLISAENTVIQNLDLEFGLELKDGIWKKIANIENHSEWALPKLGQTEGEFTVYAKPTFGLDFYELAGPFGEIKGYARAEAGYSTDMWWKLIAGLEVVAGIKVEAFGKSLANFSDVVYQYEEVLMSYDPGCDSHTNTACHNGDVYWQNSCGNFEDIADNCTSTEICVGAQCKPKTTTCEDECSIEGKLSCDGNTVVGCEEKNDGCLDKVVEENCGSEKYCSGGECKTEPPICQDECYIEGQLSCGGDNVIECLEWDDGCLYTMVIESCEEDNAECIDGACQSMDAQWFKDLGNGTVLDEQTGHVWLKSSPGAKLYWDANTYCDDLSIAGSANWRLPTAEELITLRLDTKQSNGLYLSPVFSSIDAAWSTEECDVGDRTIIEFEMNYSTQCLDIYQTWKSDPKCIKD